MIVIHEVFGLNDDIREKADRLASMGYAALAPDLMDGRGPKPICIVRVMRSLSRATGGPLDDLEDARAWLADQPTVDRSRMGVVGFCMGGGFAVLFAARANLQAAAVFYGAVPREPGALEGICPVVASYGERDRVFRGHGERLRDGLELAGVAHDWKLYPGAGHGFMSRSTGLLAKVSSWGPTKVGFHPAGADDAWGRVERFFASHLAGNDD